MQNVKTLDVVGGVVYCADCIGNYRVLFPRVVHSGETVYFIPYQVDDDSVSVYGGIHSIEHVVP